MSAIEPGFVYFQFLEKLNYPILVKLPRHMEANVATGVSADSPFVQLLKSTGFSKIEDKQAKGLLDEANCRVLDIYEATPKLTAQIGQTSINDKYGNESSVAQTGFSVYRHRGACILVYSHQSENWEMAISHSLKKVQDLRVAEIVMNRFLALALAPLGVISFWGTLMDDKAIVMNQEDSRAKTFFIDIVKAQVFNFEEIRPLDPSMKIGRFNNALSQDQLAMKEEELYSFLSVHCTYFGSSGHTVPVRQVIREIIRLYEGFHYRRSAFDQSA